MADARQWYVPLAHRCACALFSATRWMFVACWSPRQRQRRRGGAIASKARMRSACERAGAIGLTACRHRGRQRRR
ncbi:hypothetical protein XEUV354_10980 [Xanthomonas euvesicatoria]|nr:hypothetical protein XEUV685_07435 [Xanthomonas euvesicatoria]KLA73267.1 hypothetical protein XEUVF42_11750 [Xanthomonas euvesicatoria]KLA82157.1 hypothetical protein XEUVG41_05370 [Xanthomonas euvesicatoria]KLB41940.1 hypothetical protein XEUV206_09125 [Xanthomonas euvesicatoria]KLB48113.1 hypothetical protein XEUV259_01740 [Xanthomonas euvesicatoria]